MNIDTMENFIRSELHIPGDGLSSPMVLNALNDGYKEVSAKILCIEVPTPVYTIPDSPFITFTGHKVQSVYVSSLNRSIPQISPRSMGSALLSGSEPQYWCTWGNVIVLTPVPDIVYGLILYILTWPTLPLTRDLVIFQDTGDVSWEDTDVTWQKTNMNDSPVDFLTHFQSCIILFALYVLSLKLRYWNRAGRYYNLYVTDLMGKRQEYLKRPRFPRSIHQVPDHVGFSRGGR
jgi:hypothetical protein